MAKVNKRAKDYRKDETVQLAGGYGVYAAKQGGEALLRRAVMSCLLWEDLFYESGKQVAENIKNLIAATEPQTVYDIAIEARHKQKLRHVPLYIAREMARLPQHKKYVGDLLPQIITRADQLNEFLAIYWMDGKQPLSNQVKKGLAQAFTRFNEYQLAKYNRDTEIKLRDVLFMVHAKPKGGVSGYTKKARESGDKCPQDSGSQLFDKLVNGELAVPDTWEVELSKGKDKKASWERLLKDGKLGALAFLRNLRNFEQNNVNRNLVTEYFESVSGKWLLPINYFAAAKYAPRYEREIEKLMLRNLAQIEKLPGHTIFVVDISGSMSSSISGKSEFNRLDVAKMIAVIASEVTERFTLYATAGNDGRRVHATRICKSRHGFALADEIQDKYSVLGGGGIFTRQCLEYIREHEQEKPDRIMIFSDSQDCDHPHLRTPNPFGKRNYIIDVSAHSHGINYDGLWDAEISGWSEHFIDFIRAYEGLSLQEQDN